MERTRNIAASPVRPAGEAWTLMKTLLAESLERSSEVADSSVASALAPLDGIALSLIASGYLGNEPLVLSAGDLRLDIYAVRGDDAFGVEENLGPVPGAASAPASWRIYVPSPVHLRATVEAACKGREHLVSGKAPAVTESASTRSSTSSTGTAGRTYSIDPAALQRM